MKINKLVALMAAASMLFTIGEYNSNKVYASENTSTILIEDPIGLLPSKTGADTYVTDNKVTLNGAMTSGKPFRGWYKKNGTSYTKVSDNIKYIFEAHAGDIINYILYKVKKTIRRRLGREYMPLLEYYYLC